MQQVAVLSQEEAVVTRALEFPMDHVVQRYAKDHGLPLEVAREHELEVKKYLALCALTPGGGLGMSRVIDELWHTFIWFTRDYHRFCEEVAGRYLHHGPAIAEDLKTGKNVDDYAQTLALYRQYFGEPPKHLWPEPVRTSAMAAGCANPSCGNECSSSTCNACS